MDDKTCSCGCGIAIPDGAFCDTPECEGVPEWVYDAGGDGPNAYACDDCDKKIMNRR